MMTSQNILLFLSVLLSALIMGLLYGYACSVNPGLGKLPAAEYLNAMQKINEAIQNPFFFISFMGTVIVLPITTWYSKSHASSTCFYCMLAATIFYVVGVIGVTAFGNIPLNNALAKFNIETASQSEIITQRNSFQSLWNTFHLIRTICAIITTSFAVAATIFKTPA